MIVKVVRKKSITDYLVVFLSPLLATFISIYFNTSQVVSLFLFFILPSIYLTIKNPKFIKKGLVIILATIPFTLIVDHFAIKDGSWWVYTIFSFRILNNIPIEDFIWCASWFYYIVAFYEYFIDQPHGGKDSSINSRCKSLILTMLGLGFVFLVSYDFINKYIFIPYFYTFFPIVLGIIPLVLVLFNYPHLIHKFLLAICYFIFVNFLHEITALSTNQWIFPGEHYIGWIQIFKFRFPFEEGFFWMMLGASYLLAWYEYFADDAN